MRDLTDIECLELLAKFEVSEPEGGDGAWSPLPTTFSVTGISAGEGTWDSGGVEVLAWAVKAGNNFQYWYQDPANPITSGTWDTSLLGDGTPAVSHLTFYGCPSVPEPGSILAGIAALGMFALGRKRLA